MHESPESFFYPLISNLFILRREDFVQQSLMSVSYTGACKNLSSEED